MANIKLLKAALALLIFCFIFWLIDLDQLISAFKHITLELIIILLLISVALVYVSALKWKLFLEASGYNKSVFHLFNLYLLGYFINAFMPSFLGGDAIRSWYVGEKGNQHGALAATIMERLTGLIAMIIIALLALIFLPDVPDLITLTIIACGLGLFFFVLLCFKTDLSRIVQKLPIINKLSEFVKKTQDALVELFSKPKLLLHALVLSFLFHLFAIVNTIAASYAVGWTSVPLVELAIVLPIIMVISAIPITPSGLGVQEGAFMYFLVMIGASPAEALGAALILRAKNYLLAVIGGFVMIFTKR